MAFHETTSSSQLPGAVISTEVKTVFEASASTAFQNRPNSEMPTNAGKDPVEVEGAEVNVEQPETRLMVTAQINDRASLTVAFCVGCVPHCPTAGI